MARCEQEQKDRLYRVYVTDTLRCIAKGEYPTKRYAELLESPQKQDNRTGDEIAADIIARMGLGVAQ